MGDMNIYYLVWDNLSIKIEPKEEYLLKIINCYNIELIIEKDIII
jgi:hypothetical protein